MYKILFLVSFAFLTGCYSITHYPEQQHTISKSTITHTEVKVIWHKDVDEMPKECKRFSNATLYGCAMVFKNEKKSVCILHAIEPNNFNDTAKLAVLGHEFWHCLGARHQ